MKKGALLQIFERELITREPLGISGDGQHLDVFVGTEKEDWEVNRR